MEDAKRWEFRPAMRDGAPIDVEVVIRNSIQLSLAVTLAADRSMPLRKYSSSSWGISKRHRISLKTADSWSVRQKPLCSCLSAAIRTPRRNLNNFSL